MYCFIPDRGRRKNKEIELQTRLNKGIYVLKQCRLPQGLFTQAIFVAQFNAIFVALKL